ncbi:Calcium-dependent phosphotriesterase protein [Dioscorea alata]|uniref:Calcium-dependent phosphotriesterase protein n=1 Tax=Dioscorea alata TaxID=55571 RepID=A0ACB7VPD1_DIOAL|nr:Calcium-dependent phosphotriesterase protein [Dioscorea alata]
MSRRCGRTAALLLLLTAIPIALLFSLERSASGYRYSSGGWFHECAKWDASADRFLVSSSTSGTIGEIIIGTGSELEEKTVVSDADVAGNWSMGIAIDRRRNRLLVVYADVLGLTYSGVAAYDLDSWERRFLIQLASKGGEKSAANDIAVDEDGNAYITDAKANKIWKIGSNGELLSIIRSDVFVQRKEWYYNFDGLNGIIYHPNGFLLVMHTSSGHLFKVDITTENVTMVNVNGSIFMGDGLELLSPTKLVVAGTLFTKLVESTDEWNTGITTGRYIGPLHHIFTSATVKDGKVYLNHVIGRKSSHLISEANFTPLNSI